MNKLSIIGLLILVLFGSVSCDKWLDLKPESEIILEDYWKTEGDVNAVLATCYKTLTDDAVISRMIVWGELRSDNLDQSLTGGLSYDMYQILQGNLTTTNSYCSWGAFYTVINDCNTLLHFAPLVLSKDENFTQADLNLVRAEALSIRSLCYFYLVRTFKEVPWMNEASITDIQNYNVPKLSETAILDSIVTNLKYAQKYINIDFGRTDYNKGRFTLDGVNALLADVYLWKMDYDNCVKTCDLVLANNKLKLVIPTNYYSSVFYLGNSTESILELQFNDNVQKNNSVISLYGSSARISGLLRFPTNLSYNPYKTAAGVYSPFDYSVGTKIESQKDIRAKHSYNIGTGSIFKYAGIMVMDNAGITDAIYTYSSTTPNWIIYRLPEVMLMKAEALVELNGDVNFKNALSLVNETYLRSNNGQDSLSFANYNSQDEMRQLVLRERQREFLFEGKRWFDLVRLARKENSTNSLNTFVDHKLSGASSSVGAPVMNAMYMPISKSEMQNNPNLLQNPYYTTSASN